MRPSKPEGVMALPHTVQLTGTTASSSYAAYTTVGVAGDSDRAGYTTGTPPIMRVFANCDASSGSATIRVAFLDDADGTCFYVEDATVAVTANRTGAANSSGNYLCTVTFSVSGRDTVDLMGHLNGHMGAKTKIVIGVAALTTIASLVIVATTSHHG